MINSTSIAFLLLAGIAVADIVASALVMQSAIYSSAQKGLQLALVWLIPLLGAAVVLVVWAHDRKYTLRDTDCSGEDSAWLPGIGPTSDVSHPTETFGDFGHDGHGSDGGGHSN